MLGLSRPGSDSRAFISECPSGLTKYKLGLFALSKIKYSKTRRCPKLVK